MTKTTPDHPTWSEFLAPLLEMYTSGSPFAKASATKELYRMAAILDGHNDDEEASQTVSDIEDRQDALDQAVAECLVTLVIDRREGNGCECCGDSDPEEATEGGVGE